MDTIPSRRPRRSCSSSVLLALGATLLLPAPALARGVYLNGVNIEGVTQQKFEDVLVEIDEQGNIWITARGYEVQALPPPSQAPAASAEAGPVTRRYFLVSETNAPGLVEFDIDVFVNSVWVKRLSHEERQTVTDISRFMRLGKNRVQFTANKVSAGARKSTSARHAIKLIVGEGNIAGNNVTIDRPLVEYSRSAAEGQSATAEYELVGR